MVSRPPTSVDRVHLSIVSSSTDLLQPAEQQVCNRGQTDRKQSRSSRYRKPPTPRLLAPRRCCTQFLDPNFFGFVLKLALPDKCPQTAVIVGSERNEAERLQRLADWTQHLLASKHRPGA